MATTARPAGPEPPSSGPLRRAYRTSDVRYLARHYPHATAAACARALGRTVGSLRNFIHRYPELRKQGRP